MDGVRGLRLKRAWVAPPGIICPLGLVSLTSSPLGASHAKILRPKKSQINLSLGRSLKCQNTKTGFSYSVEL
jgi:hypothetical protein